MSAIISAMKLIIGFLESLFSFVGSVFTGITNLVKMIPQTVEAVSMFTFMFPAWVWYPLVSIVNLVVALALLKWIKGAI